MPRGKDGAKSDASAADAIKQSNAYRTKVLKFKGSMTPVVEMCPAMLKTIVKGLLPFHDTALWPRTYSSVCLLDFLGYPDNRAQKKEGIYTEKESKSI